MKFSVLRPLDLLPPLAYARGSVPARIRDRKGAGLPVKELALLLASAAVAFGSGIDPQSYLSHIRYLASPDLKGRGAGSKQLDEAAKYIAKQFRAAGLEPTLQPFSLTTKARAGASTLERVDGPVVQALRLGDGFVPFNFSGNGSFEGGVVFAGFGITAPEYDYDDYAGIDARHKFVIILRHEPREFEDGQTFSGRIYTEHSQFLSKALNAERHGAAGLIMVTDLNAHTSGSDVLEPFTTVGPGPVRLPVLQVKADVVASWVGRDLAEVGRAIDKDLKPRSFEIDGALRLRTKIDIRRRVRTVYNVLGVLRGKTDEHVVLGAHYDHLGRGEMYSMAPSPAGLIHPGADDNASGTAGLIELARFFAARPRSSRSIVFAAFAGEELGLLGSGFYVRNPVLPIERAVAMLNMDMIGRIRESRVHIGGSDSGHGLRDLLDKVVAKHGLEFDYGGAVYGSSDHMPFAARLVPSVFFFSGLHGDYHRPADTWDKIDHNAAARLLEVIADLTMELTGGATPTFVRSTGASAAGVH